MARQSASEDQSNGLPNNVTGQSTSVGTKPLRRSPLDVSIGLSSAAQSSRYTELDRREFSEFCHSTGMAALLARLEPNGLLYLEHIGVKGLYEALHISCSFEALFSQGLGRDFAEDDLENDR